jgi:hypothetical protein
MGPHISERQFEFSVNFELTASLGAMLVGGAPMIPTTNVEAKKGYDALFNLGSGYLYHLQYKVGSYASRRTWKNLNQWALHGGPYFRFGLLEDSKGICSQHGKLEELRKREPGVYYCAPLFFREDDYWGHAAASSVFANSALIDVDDVQLPGRTGSHAITFDSSGVVQAWSDPGEPSRSDREPEIRRRTDPRQINRTTFEHLLLNFVEALISEESITARVRQSRPGAGLRTSIIDARTPDSVRGRSSSDTRENAPDGSDEANERDRQLAADTIAAFDDVGLVDVLQRVAAVDFGLVTVVEPV